MVVEQARYCESAVPPLNHRADRTQWRSRDGQDGRAALDLCLWARARRLRASETDGQPPPKPTKGTSNQ